MDIWHNHRGNQNMESQPPWLKLRQISNVLPKLSSPVSKWTEKFKSLCFKLSLAPEWSKPFSYMAFFSDNPQHIWLGFDNSEALQKLENKTLIFSGHLDIGQAKSVKKFIIQHNLSQGGTGLLFEIGQLSTTQPFGWIKTWDHPFTASISVKPQISCLLWVALYPNGQKKIVLDMQTFTWLQNHQLQIR